LKGVSFDKLCYHYDVVDDIVFKKVHSRTKEVITMLVHEMDARLEESKVYLHGTSDVMGGTTDTTSITFVPLTQVTLS
jgi:hypothetical protein